MAYISLGTSLHNLYSFLFCLLYVWKVNLFSYHLYQGTQSFGILLKCVYTGHMMTYVSIKTSVFMCHIIIMLKDVIYVYIMLYIILYIIYRPTCTFR